MENQQNIQTVLDKIAKGTKNDYGLYSGKTGAAYCYFLLSRQTHREEHEQKAIELLLEVSRAIGCISDLTFSHGLTGIGWGLEAMVQNGFIHLNTDKVLYDFDDTLYSSVTRRRSASISLDAGTLGKSLFFYQRFLSRNPNIHPYRKIANLECLILLTDEIKDFFIHKEWGLFLQHRKLTDDELLVAAQCFFLLHEIVKSKINKDVTGSLLYYLKNFVTCYYNNPAFNKRRKGADLFLLYAYTVIAFRNNDTDMIHQARSWHSKYDIKLRALAQTPLDRFIYYKWCQAVGKQADRPPLPEEAALPDLLIQLDDPACPVPWLRGWLLG